MDKELVKKYIASYATQSIKTRAIAIYNSSALKFQAIDYKEKIAKYTVKGTKMYKVEIKNYDSKYMNIKCSCPYDWSSLCKHGLAALYHLEKNYKKISISEQITTANKMFLRKSSEPVEIFDFENITNSTLKKYHINNNTSYAHYEFQIVSVDFNSIEIIAYNYRDEIVIVIEKKGNKIFLYSDTDSYAKTYSKPHLYSPEYKLLEEFSNYNPTFLYKIFNKEEMLKVVNSVAKDYGLKDAKKTLEYFNIYPDFKETFIPKLKEEFKGLVPINKSANKETLDSFLKAIVKPKKVKSLNKITKKEFVLGFMVHKDIDDEIPMTSIEIIKGSFPKKNKNDLIKIKEYRPEFDQHKCSITENQNKILVKIHSLEELLGKNQISLEQAEVNEMSIVMLKEIFKLLKSEKYVYFNTNKNGYNNYRSRIYKGELKRISIPEENILKVKFNIEKEDDFIKAKVKFYTNKGEIKIPTKQNEFTGYGVFLLKDNLYVADSNQVFDVYSNFNTSPLTMQKKHEEEFVENYVMPLSQKFDISFDDDLKYKMTKEYLEPEKKQIFLDEEDDYLVITPQVKYDNDIETKLTERQDIYKKQKFELIQYVRDQDYEDDYLDFIENLHPDFEEQKDDAVFYIAIEEMTKDMWFFNFFDKLKSNNVEIFGLKELKKFKYSPHKANIQTSISSGEDWFDVDVDVSFGKQKLTLKDIRKAIVNKDKFIKLSDDSVGVLPEEWLQKMESYFRHGEIQSGQLKVSKMKFSIIDELFEDIDQEEILKEIYEKKKLLKSFKKIDKIKIPKEITAELRDYQKEGLNWLHFLNKMKWGGILADDMGLGKTIQVIALLQSIINKSKVANLVVLPTSLLFNWENELKKFAPKLKPFFFYGTSRKRNKSIFKKNSLIITTYGVMAKDIEFLTQQKFNYVILDESQAIKNPNSQRYKAAMLLNAKNKLTLTGTPIENNTFDLYAQMNFVNPGFFGSIKNFKDNYAMPIDKDGDVDIAKELQQLISPFLLRRTKEQVATELPPKTEDIIYCEMLPKQQKIYDAYKNEYRNKILEKIETDGLNKSKLFVLSALTKLRQICDSPLLLKDKHINTSESAKIKLLLEHINEKTANHKILVFSQFTSMLALIRDELDKSNVLYEYLDGKSTIKNRQKCVENFQGNAKVRVFLISLKAGGTGLNLTEADYVYIVDPWWNPAVENQAIDRCYRIGQTKSVMAYRMICKNTIEEKIIKLQNKKKKLATDIIQTDEKIMKTIDKSSLMDLFS